MANTVPSSLALSVINTNDPINSAPHRNNYAAIQSATNGLITCLSGGTSGQLLSAVDGTDVQWVAGFKPTYRKVTVKIVSNTTTETDLLNGEITVAANALGTNNTLRLTVSGNIANSDALLAMPRFKLKLGATVMLDTGAGPTQWSTGGESAFKIVAEIINLGAANSQAATLDGTFTGSLGSGSANFVTGIGTYATNTTNVGFACGWNNGLAVDTTANQALSLTVTLPVANAGVSASLQSALVEII